MHVTIRLHMYVSALDVYICVCLFVQLYVYFNVRNRGCKNQPSEHIYCNHHLLTICTQTAKCLPLVQDIMMKLIEMGY